MRDDLEQLISEAHQLDLYTNLITSGVPLEPRRLVKLVERGLNSIQLSIQGATAQASDLIAGVLLLSSGNVEVARWVKESGLPLTINVVMHRRTSTRLTISSAWQSGLRRIAWRLATAQYVGWLVESAGSASDSDQLDRTTAARAAKARLSDRMDIVFVLPDYYSDVPKTCMDGWGRRVYRRDARWSCASLPCGSYSS